MVKVLVIGIDCGSWNVIQPLVKEGKLPTIKRLMDNSVWGNLKSCEYYYTSPAWKCYSTGKNPGKLGAIVWWSFDKNDKSISLVSSRSFKSKELWDILGEHGLKCGIINMPLTFPPKYVNGVLVTGPPHPDEGCTYPPELEKEIKQDGYRINPKFDLMIDKDKAISEIADLINKHFLLGEKLLKKSDFDFFQHVIFLTDPIQHHFWKHMEEGDPKYGNVIEDCWKLVDSGIGKLLDSVNEDCYTIIMSDHGATASKGAFRLNLWLNLRGYLHLRSHSFRNMAERMRIKLGFPYHMRFPLSLLGNVLVKFGRAFFNINQQRSAREKLRGNQAQNILWKKTKVLSVDQDCMYITVDDNDLGFENELIDEIRNLRNPKSGEKVVRDVKRKEELFEGKYLHQLPDLIIIPEDGYTFVSTPLSGSAQNVWDFSRKGWSGTHRLNGIFLANGPGVKKGENADEATIYDLVPTILHIFGLPIPTDVYGRVLKEIFEENSELAKKPVTYEKGERKWEEEKEKKHYLSEEEQIAERLKNLGYM